MSLLESFYTSLFVSILLFFIWIKFSKSYLFLKNNITENRFKKIPWHQKKENNTVYAYLESRILCPDRRRPLFSPPCTAAHENHHVKGLRDYEALCLVKIEFYDFFL